MANVINMVLPAKSLQEHSHLYYRVVNEQWEAQVMWGTRSHS